MLGLGAALDTLPWPLLDRLRLSIRFRRRFGRWPALTNPRSFNEHILHYKLASRGDPRFPQLADKVEAKKHIAALVGSGHVIPTYWHGRELPPREQRGWPKPYVIKSTHASQHVILVRNDKEEDWDGIDAITAQWLSRTYEIGRRQREWHYAQIPPRLLVEKMLGDGLQPPTDYKLFVFDGRVELIEVDQQRYVDHRRSFFDREWRLQPFELKYPRPDISPRRPATLEAMIGIAETLGRNFEFVRVDLYEAEGRIYCGELTFFPIAGTGRFHPPEADYAVGSLWRGAGATGQRASR